MLKVSTNADGLTCGDLRITRIIAGKIQPGSLVLLNGEADTGKSILCQQLSYNVMYNSAGAVAYFTSCKKPSDLLDQMESFSFHVQYHFVADKLRVYPLAALNYNPHFNEAVRLLLGCLDNLPPSFTLAVIDHVNPLLAGMTPETQIGLLNDIRALCRKNRRSAIVVTNPFVFSKNNLFRIYTLCDYYLGTDIVPAPVGLEQMDSRTMRSLELRKMGGVELPNGEQVRFEIRGGTGIHILPYMTVRA
ncbi:MAG: ATPase domain-containing protein [Dehalococcoidales bacterium]|nr:ATPase domain-containing protein [Dehalococcoidales bacterium]